MKYHLVHGHVMIGGNYVAAPADVDLSDEDAINLLASGAVKKIKTPEEIKAERQKKADALKAAADKAAAEADAAAAALEPAPVSSPAVTSVVTDPATK